MKMRIRLDGVGERNIPFDAISGPWLRFSARTARKKLNSRTMPPANLLAPIAKVSSSGTYNQRSNNLTSQTAFCSPLLEVDSSLRWTMGLVITIVGFGVMLVSLVGVFFGSQLSGVESDIGSGTGLGAGVIIFSILVGLFGLALAIAGIGAIRRNFAAFVACAVLSVLGTLGGIGQIIELGFQIDAILGLLFWAAH